MKALLARRGAAGGSDDTPVAGTPDGVTVVTWVVAVVALLGLLGILVFGASWWFAGHGSDAETAITRDDALVAARQIAVNLQTLDHATVDRGLDTWQDSATGPLLDEFRKNRQQYADQVRTARVSSTARVIDVALSSLDVAAGTARAIAAVDVKTVQEVNGTLSLPITRQVRIQLDLVRTPDAGWKAARAAAVRP